MRSRQKIILFRSLALAFLAVTVYVVYNAARPSSQPEDLSPFPVAGYHRLLVLSPHCDDETLGAGGLIHAALRAGLDVRVVIETNGDGYLFATMEDFRRIYPHAPDFIHMGNIRQQESLSALRLLGLPEKNVTFLSYPDRGTPELWNDHWLAADPYRSLFTESTHSPYPITYNPDAVYAGEDLLADLLAIIRSYRPDVIAYPHPDDVHPDHWGLSAFTRLALATAGRDDPEYHPTTLAYLVHRPDFPEPHGLHLDRSLLPPEALYQIYRVWYRVDLLPKDVQLKSDAIQEYHTQLPLLHGLMERFVRRNELFAQPQPAVLSDLKTGDPDRPDTWQDTSGAAIAPIQLDPQRDFITREFSGKDDLIAVFAARTSEGNLLVCSQTRGAASPLLIYTLWVNGVSDTGVFHHGARNDDRPAAWHVPKIVGPYVCDQVNLAELGNPWLVFIGANVEEVGTGILDQIAWQAVIIGRAGLAP
jgi:LmbE family N-acetylglucosaminyl deacetylase